MTHKIVLLLCLFLAFVTRPALADGELYAAASTCVYSISAESYIRSADSVSAYASLGADEYYTFVFTLTNNTGYDQNLRTLYARIDGGEAMHWSSYTLKARSSVMLHIYHSNMKNVTPGIHQMTLYANDRPVATASFVKPRSWSSVMQLPTSAELRNQNAVGRSPYIVFYPEFRNVKGFTEFAVDFTIDDAPNGTYLSLLNWSFDRSDLKKRYDSVYTDFGDSAGYCGLQVLEDGTHSIILTIWDTFCKDRSGQVTRIRANLLNPADRKSDEFDRSGEGSFVHCVYPYNWRIGRPYRLLIQQSTTSNGTAAISMWLCDLTSGAWDQLVEYDTGLRNTFMTNPCGFLECFDLTAAADVRTAQMSNFRARSQQNGQWVGARSMTFTVNNSMIADAFNYTGSYNFGAQGNTFWVITSGLKNRCRQPSSGSTYTVTQVAADSPY